MTLTISEADKAFQDELVQSLAMAHLGGLLEPEGGDVQKWARRWDALSSVLVNIYGEPAANALKDQARAEGERIALAVR